LISLFGSSHARLFLPFDLFDIYQFINWIHNVLNSM
jgi:hypothetical protein